MNRVIPSSPKPAEWYQVMYNLAAQKAHAAMEPGKYGAVPPFLRGLSLFRDRREDERRRRLLLEAHHHARKLLKQTAISILAHGEAPRTRGEPERLDRKLRAFLEETVEPTAAVLLAGVTRAAEFKSVDRRAITTREELVQALNTGTPSPDTLVAYVTERRDLPFRVRYNLACYYADDNAALAWRNFKAALTDVPRLEATVLADWAQRDPSLEALRTARREEFDRLLRLYRLPKFEDHASAETPESTGTRSSVPFREPSEEKDMMGPLEGEEQEEREEPEEPHRPTTA
jgi:hypothetical protein